MDYRSGIIFRIPPPPLVVFGKILVKPPVPTRMDGFYYNFVEDRGITKIYNEY